jgi:hypothetical protein
MATIGRRSDLAVTESGRAYVIVSEHLTRARGTMSLGDGTRIRFRCRETPWPFERVLFLGRLPLDSGIPSLVPVLIREGQPGEEGAPDPQHVRYLRHCVGPNMVYDRDRGEFTVFWWWNLFRPPELPAPCPEPILMPFRTVFNAGAISISSRVIPPHECLRKTPQDYYAGRYNPTPRQLRAEDSYGLPGDPPVPCPPDPDPADDACNDYPSGVLFREGSVSLAMDLVEDEIVRFADDSPQPPPQGLWEGIVVSLVGCRRDFLEGLAGDFSPTGEGSVRESDAGRAIPPLYQPPYSDTARGRAIRISGTVSVAGGDPKPIQWRLTDGSRTESLEISHSTDSVFPSQIDGDVDLESTVPAEVHRRDSDTELRETAVVVISVESRHSRPASGPIPGFFVGGVTARLLCGAPDQESLVGYYGETAEIPLPYAELPPEGEPHREPEVSADPDFRGAVGDAPAETTGIEAGLVRRFAIDRSLLAGGASHAAAFSPLVVSGGHQRLQPTPGLITGESVVDIGARIDLSTIPGETIRHTKERHHSLETSASSLAVSVRMSAKGRLYRLEMRESTPPGSGESAADRTVRVSASALRPARKGEAYVGPDSRTIEDGTLLFPFGVSVPGFVVVDPGEVGHQFLASGGTPPYRWSLRPLRRDSGGFPGYPTLPGDEPPFLPDGSRTSEELPDYATAGGLPPGMILSEDGLLYGTPSSAGDFAFRAYAEDSAGKSGEATFLLQVMSESEERPVCDEEIQFPDPRRVTPAGIRLPPYDFASGSAIVGRLSAVGGTPPYRWRNTNPLDVSVGGAEGIRVASGGEVTVVSPSTIPGIYSFVAEVADSTGSCARAAVSAMIGVPEFAVVGDSPEEDAADPVGPEGPHASETPFREWLILDPPIAVSERRQLANLVPRGTRGHTVRPDLAGPYIRGGGPISGVSPGILTPVGLFGAWWEETGSSVPRMDYALGDPEDFTESHVDRFEPSPDETGSIVGATIDAQTTIGKRIRPLWPG